MTRKLPNIAITGTPGVGKTTTASLLCSLSSSTSTPLKHLAVNDLVKARSLHEGYDDRLKTLVVDEDKVLDELEKEIGDGEGEAGGGWVLDWHVCDLYPERWIDLVVVLRCGDTGVFHDRLAGSNGAAEEENKSTGTGTGSGTRGGGGGRGYEGDKLQENIDAEIFGVVADEAREGYPGEGRVVELESVKVEDIDENCDRILEWVANWVANKTNEKE